MTATDTCVSLGTGTLSPSLRVNYAYGMVLGLDEFLQEQLHRLEQAYRHERALHGYGTVHGLRVTTEPTDGAPDFTVTISPGLAVDQRGREVVVDRAQCARLGAWLAAREQQSPGSIAGHLGISGDLTVYVVASYASCLDNLVPLPGQPCSSSEQTLAASRVRDAWDIDLRWQPPPMPRWDTDRRLARLLDSVKVVVGLDHGDSDEEDLVAEVLALGAAGPSDLGPPMGPSGPVDYQLPADVAAEVLDRIFTVWVTQVRPLMEPDLTSPAESADPAVLLASITFTPDTPFQLASPSIASCSEPDDTGRPYLLHTELIQQLHRLGELVPAPPPAPVELVTLAPSIDQAGKLRLDAWFHLDRPVSLTAAIEVSTESGTVAAFTAAASGSFSTRWTLTAPDGFVARPGEQLRVLFPAADVLVGDPSTTLGDVQVELLNAMEDGGVAAYAVVPAPPPAPPPVKTVASVEFVTITSAVGPDSKELRFELWFHPQPRGPRDDVFVVEPLLRAFDEITGDRLRIRSLNQDNLYRNLWLLVTEVPNNQRPIPAYVRFLFPTKDFLLEAADAGRVTLDEWIDKAEIAFVGWDKATIVAFNRVGPMPGGER